MYNLFGLALGVFADVTRQRGALVGIGTVIVAASVLLTEWSRESAGAKRDPAEARSRRGGLGRGQGRASMTRKDGEPFPPIAACIPA
jgi:hypothetical protein